jgi:hypothetical protein
MSFPALGRYIFWIFSFIAVSGFYMQFIGLICGWPDRASQRRHTQLESLQFQAFHHTGQHPNLTLASGSEIRETRLDQVRVYGTVLDPAGLSRLANEYVSAVSSIVIAETDLNAVSPAFAREQLFRVQNAGEALEGYWRAAAALTAARADASKIAEAARREWGDAIGAALIQSDPLIERLVRHEEFLIQVSAPSDLCSPAPHSALALVDSTRERLPMHLLSPAPRADAGGRCSLFYLMSASPKLQPGMNVFASMDIAPAR